jgi:hypothetical protein
MIYKITLLFFLEIGPLARCSLDATTRVRARRGGRTPTGLPPPLVALPLLFSIQISMIDLFCSLTYLHFAVNKDMVNLGR